MAGPVYKLFLVKGRSEAWHQLSQEEKDSLMAKHDESFEKAGGKPILYCDSKWSSGQWATFGVEEFPSIEAVQEHEKDLVEMDLHRYTRGSMYVLGTKWEESS
jgi:hypothetical protein